MVNHSCVFYPIMISAVGVLSGMITIGICACFSRIVEEKQVECRLKWLLFISTLVQTVFVWLVGSMCLPHTFLHGDFKVLFFVPC